MTAPSLQISILALALASCAPARSEEARTPNVVIVSIDTLRGDQLGRAGPDGASLTPVLDALAAESVQFSAAFSQSNETLFSHASMFTGRYPSELGALDYMSYRIAPGTPTLASRLADAGYRTEAVVGGGHMAPAFGMQAGFHRYRSTSDFSGFQETMPIALQTLDQLAAEEQPFLLFVHGYDCHTPYIKPGPAGRIFSPDYSGPLLDVVRSPIIYEQITGDWYAPDFQPEVVRGAGRGGFISTQMFDALREHVRTADPETLIALDDADKAFLLGTYDAAAMYADMWLGVLLAELEATGLADKTVLMVVSDHGEDLLEHGFFNHRAGLWQTTTRVPMIMRAPGLQPQVREDLGSIQDVSATLLGLAGLEHGLPGLDLSAGPAPDDRIVLSQGAGGQLAAWSAGRGLSVQDRALLDLSIPQLPPDGVDLYGPAGAPLPWSEAEAAPLWSRLQRELSDL
jgi:arylsulfatase A-like enzyme